MLDSSHRLASGQRIRDVVRRGRRASAGGVTVHLLATGSGLPPRVAFIVTRRAGGAVQRNRLQRQLRHLMRERIGALAPGEELVVRCSRSGATSADLARSLDRSLDQARR